MLKKETPVNLIPLLASYRRVEFTQAPCTRIRVKKIAETIDGNCSITIRFADRMLRQMQNDSEELFSLCCAREQALELRRACRAIAISRRHRNGAHHELVTLRSQYDTFMSSVRHFFFLLDRDLAGRIDGALKE